MIRINLLSADELGLLNNGRNVPGGVVTMEVPASIEVNNFIIDTIEPILQRGDGVFLRRAEVLRYVIVPMNVRLNFVDEMEAKVTALEGIIELTFSNMGGTPASASLLKRALVRRLFNG